MAKRRLMLKWRAQLLLRQKTRLCSLTLRNIKRSSNNTTVDIKLVRVSVCARPYNSCNCCNCYTNCCKNDYMDKITKKNHINLHT